MKDYKAIGRRFLRKHKLVMDTDYKGQVSNPFGDEWEANHYVITLRHADVEQGFRFDYYQGLAHTKDPDAYSVLTSLRSGFSSYDCARDRDDFLRELGYDRDLASVRRGEAAWEQIEEHKNDFIVWFGQEVYDSLAKTEGLA